MPRIVDNYSLNSLIGEGVYGRVYLAHHIKSGQQFAVKVVPMQRFQENPKLEECTFNEIQTLSQVAPGCPNIVGFV
jgi:serine/threonine protein kinase